MSATVVAPDSLHALTASIGMQVQYRADNAPLWDETLERVSYKPIVYRNSSLDYQSAYQRAHGGNWQDLSLIIYWDRKPSALWPLSLSVKGGRPMLTSHGLPVLPPIFLADCTAVSRKRITKDCLNLANTISNTAKLESWESGESFGDSLGMSFWHVESMKRGATCRVYHDLYVDLRQDMAGIKRNFRHRFKSLVSAGSQMWDVGVTDSRDEIAWRDFRALHLRVSGRMTRSDETWDLHFQDIERNQSFLVWLRNGSGEMTGGGLFEFTASEGGYSVGAYDRTLFSKPLGHVVQYRAIEELKRRGVIWYKIGERAFPMDNPAPTAKEISISEFKQGFATHVFPHYRITHNVVSHDKP